MDFERLQNVAGIEVNAITILDNRFNVNRKIDDIILLNDFSNASPLFNVEHGPYLEISTKHPTIKKIVHLSGSAASGLLIENSSKISDEEYFTKFVEKKKEFVNEWLIRNTFARGFKTPTAIQAITLPEIIQKKDVLVQSKSGTGKTHAFLFGCLWHFDPNDYELQHVFITSSHEVASQIYEQAKCLLPPETKITLCIGQKKENSRPLNGGFKTTVGTSTLTNQNSRQKTIKEEREEISNSQVIIGTMGKFYDFMFNKKWINTDYLKTLCVDEFDNIVSSRSRSRSISMSTEKQMAVIIEKIPKGTQRLFFSATVSEEALYISRNYFRQNLSPNEEPLIIVLNIYDYTLEGIRQYYYPCRSFQDKIDILFRILNQCRIAQGIIFTNSSDTAEKLKDILDKQAVRISSEVFHGNLEEKTRSNIYKNFVNNKIRLLISTDLTSRGLDIQSINVVINFDMPDSVYTYIHRVGRSGRYGRKGTAISLLVVNNHSDEIIKVNTINDHSYKSKMEELPDRLDNLL
ncbi:MAG: mimivirus translation initiation factor 4a [Satyrvirus sp.]|uniref:Mimivirus translation initiation factor 4a n=1 Tax=Satyrvirus sp. TaxID=2487771 RepID=A0A3G5ADN7_9VIRU|nr:MAG: mimivirus translation initiation factor 4a [Satyrvirus sp.]